MAKENQDAHFILQDSWGRVTRVSPENVEKFEKQQAETKAKAEAGELKNPTETVAANIEAELGKEAGDLYRELMGLQKQ